MTNIKKPVVFVGLSGGVDSSVSAALLKEAGFEVVGVFIKVWQPPQERFQSVCTWRDDRRDAMKVAAKLQIPFLTLDLSAAYKKEVVDYMIDEYRAGLTPNPDIMCNKAIKFGAFFKWAKNQGADFIATGHYARIEKNNDNFELKMGVDKNKDQSYFLWRLEKNQLNSILFPLGELKKDKVRQLAHQFKLPTATKKDSQGLCFIGKLDLKDFLKDYIKTKPGNIVTTAGQVIGKHQGAFFYTLGERHGFEIIADSEDSNKRKPFYIIAKDLIKNELIVSSNKLAEHKSKKHIKLEKVNWPSGAPETDKYYTCRWRHRGELKTCQIRRQAKDWEVVLVRVENDVSSGQSMVIYDNDTCLGGGVIV